MYNIFKKTALEINSCVNTTASRYPATIVGKAWRKFQTRNAARAFKRTLRNPTDYAIVTDYTNAKKYDGTVVPVGFVVR